jgi:glycosyltransferase involved in cell wall biosynthesis
VIVPTRNAADWIVACLEAIRAAEPAEVILVDGRSEDGTVLLAEPFVDRLIRDDRSGPGAARNLGVTAATAAWIAFVDADVILPPDAFRLMLREARRRHLDGLQIGLRSEGSDPWSDQLAWHHNHGRSRSWFGVSATILKRSVAEAHPFDPSLASGEDADLRLRLETAEVPVGVSEDLVARHRFAPGYDAAREQFAADGAGLGRLVRKHGRPALRWLAIPFLAGAYWIGHSLRAPRRLAYFASFVAGNWRSAFRGLLDERVSLGGPGAGWAVGLALVGLLGGAAALALAAWTIVLLVALLLPAIPRFILDAAWLGPLAAVAVLGLVGLEVSGTLADDHPWRIRAMRYRWWIVGLTIGLVVVTGLRLLANLRLLG